MIEFSSPFDGRSVVQIRQRVTIGPERRTFELFAPVSGWSFEQSSITLADESGKLLAHFPPDGQKLRVSLATINNLIGVSGRGADLRGLRDTAGNAPIGTEQRYLDPTRLPDVAIGFDALQLLVLNEAALVRSRDDIAAITPAQQRAIVDWVRAGGNLILWPGEDGVPAVAPLAGALPARVLSRYNIGLSNNDLQAIGLPANATTLALFKLIANPGAKPVDLFGDGQAVAYRWRLGLGNIAIAPLNVSALPIRSIEKRRAIWMRLAQGIMSIEALSEVDSYHQQMQPEPDSEKLQDSALRAMGVPPAVRQSQSASILLALIATLAVVGPLDSFALKFLGQRALNPFTIAGWLAFITCVALLVGRQFTGPPLRAYTLRAVDQVDDATVATMDCAVVTGPPRRFSLDADRESWWQPIAGPVSEAGLCVDLQFHQTTQGNMPGPADLAGWNARLLRGETLAKGPACIAADLHLQRNGSGAQVVVGRLTNLTDHPLTNIHIAIRSGAGVCQLFPLSAPLGQSARARLSTIAPRSTVRLAAALSRPDQPTHAADPNAAIRAWVYALSPQRTAQIARLLATKRYAIIYAQIANPASAVSIDSNAKTESHRWQFLRAVVPLAQEQH